MRLKANARYILVIYRVWKFSAGLNDSTMIENLQHTFKHELDGKSIALHRLPAYLAKTVRERKLKLDVKSNHSKTL